MSRTLKLTQSLLKMGRHYQQMGRTFDAAKILARLTRFRDLPARVAEETQVCLAEILISRHKYNRARRHLTAALAFRPENARYHYMMASVLAADEKFGRQRAAEHYRKSLQLLPNQPRCLSEWGLLALQLGFTTEGLDCLRRAAELSADDPEIIASLIRGLQEENYQEEARGFLRAAMFRNPRDLRFRKLWNDLQFDLLREKQEDDRRKSNDIFGADEGPIILPFVRIVPGTAPAHLNRKTLRHDQAEPTKPPHRGRPTRLPHKRHAQ